MSALDLYRTKRGAYVDTCSEPDCNRQGRVKLTICGHIVPNSRKTSIDRQEILCLQCAEEAQEIWDRYSGKTAHDLLSGSQVERCDGVEMLREIGYSAKEAAEAAREVREAA